MPAPLPANPPSRRARWPLVALGLLQCVHALTLVPWFVVAGLAVMAFDSPDAAQHWMPWIFVGAVWSYPLWLLAAAVGSWVLVWRRRSGWALTVAGAMTLPALGFAIFLAR